MNWAIAQLPGLSSQDQAHLAEQGIETTQQLLKTAWTADDRQALATQLQIHIHHVNKWFALANLARVPSVGCQYCGLLLHAGISNPAQLAQLSPANLHRQILRLKVTTEQRPEDCPGFDQVVQWIEQARQLCIRR
jgi:predicted flap endonuclease-1-like 5' DNA nuclease